MQSPKYIFYLTGNNNILSFKKDMFINESNQITWTEIHVTQFVIWSPYKKIMWPHEGTSMTIKIENFNENIDAEDNYTFKILNVDEPYKYDNRYSSKIIDPTQFTIKDNKVELKLNILIENDPIDKWSYIDDDMYDSTLFEIELYFK
jgi:hypothetical protein